MENGCLEPLVVWNGKIVDGHTRYRICWQHGIPFSYIEMDFESVSDAVVWAIREQLARRNLTSFQRCELVLPFEAELRAEAKKRQGWRGNYYGSRSKGKETRDILAEMQECHMELFLR